MNAEIHGSCASRETQKKGRGGPSGGAFIHKERSPEASEAEAMPRAGRTDGVELSVLTVGQHTTIITMAMALTFLASFLKQGHSQLSLWVASGAMFLQLFNCVSIVLRKHVTP